MSIPLLTLQTDKNTTSVDVDRITIRQSESGLVLKANLVDSTGSAYDLTNCKVSFGENKNGGKMVDDDNINIINAKSGQISYKLHTTVYQESGSAWFEIEDDAHQLIDTTTNFFIEVLKQAELPVENDNYWSKAETMLTHFKALMQKVQNDLDNFETTNNKKLNDSINNFQNTLDGLQTRLDKLNTDYSDALNALKADWTTKQNDFITTNQQVVTNKINKFQSDFNTWLDQANIKLNSEVTKLNDELAKDEAIQADLQKSIDSAMEAVKTIKGVDFTQFAHLDDLKKYYTRDEIKSLDPLNSADGNNIYDSTINLDTYSVVGMTKFLNCKLQSSGKMAGFDQATDKLYGWIFNVPKWNGATEIQQIVFIWDFGDGELIYYRTRVDTTTTKDFKRIATDSDLKNAHVDLAINGHKPDANGNIDLSDFFGTLDKFGGLYGMTSVGTKKLYNNEKINPDTITETGAYKISACTVDTKVDDAALAGTQWGWLIVLNYDENDTTNTLYQFLIINEKIYRRVASLQYKTFPSFKTIVDLDSLKPIKDAITTKVSSVNGTKPDSNGNVAIAIPDNTQNTNDITDLKNEYAELKDREIVHQCDDLATGTAYSKAHPNVIVGTP